MWKMVATVVDGGGSGGNGGGGGGSGGQRGEGGTHLLTPNKFVLTTPL